MENLSGNFETKKELRHSHYATSKIFGPLSAKFEPFVLPSSLTHRSYKLFPKTRVNRRNRGSTGGASNFSSGSGYVGQQKRAASSFWDTPRNKIRQSNGFTKSISPQEALRRSKKNFGRQNRFFQGNQGKGKRGFQNVGSRKRK